MSVALVVLGSCKSDDEWPAQIDDPLDDPWVDAIDTGEQQPAPALASNAPDPTPEQVAPLRGTEAGAVAVAPVASPVSSHAPADKTDAPATAPDPTPEQRSGETPTPASSELPAPEQPAEPAPSIEPPSATTEPAAPPSPPPITSSDFHGNYRFDGGQAQRDAVADAIETTVNALSSAIRGIARRRLTEVNPVDGKVDIVVAGDKLTTTFESGFTVTCVVDGGTAHATALDGSKLDVRLRAKGNKLVQQMQGKGGARTIVYVLSTDRKKLTIHNKVTSKRLPVPLTYRTTYTRK